MSSSYVCDQAITTCDDHSITATQCVCSCCAPSSFTGKGDVRALFITMQCVTRSLLQPNNNNNTSVQHQAIPICVTVVQHLVCMAWRKGKWGKGVAAAGGAQTPVSLHCLSNCSGAWQQDVKRVLRARGRACGDPSSPSFPPKFIPPNE